MIAEASTEPDIRDYGAVLVHDFVSLPEEVRLLNLINAASWSTELRRRVQHYGFRYDYRARVSERARPATPFPKWARVLGVRLGPYFAGRAPEQCIVNEYVPGQGIASHADHRSFGPVVASLSLGDDWPMYFRAPGQAYARHSLASDQVLVLPRRSVLVLTGPARRAWLHGIDPAHSADCARTRVSATFRTLAA